MIDRADDDLILDAFANGSLTRKRRRTPRPMAICGVAGRPAGLRSDGSKSSKSLLPCGTRSSSGPRVHGLSRSRPPVW